MTTLFVAAGGADTADNGTANAPYRTIAFALGKAEPGDTVVVLGTSDGAPALFREALTIDTPEITLEARGAVALELPETMPDTPVILDIAADDVTVTGFEIRGAETLLDTARLNALGLDAAPEEPVQDLGYGLRVTGDGVTLRDLTVRDNLTDGIFADGAKDLLIENSVIFDNQSAGVRINGTDGVTIRGSELFSTTPGGGRSEGSGGPGSQTNGLRTGDELTRNTKIESTLIKDHGRYGIEVINRTGAEDGSLADLVRHETLVVRDSHLDGNGNQFTGFFGDTDDSLRFGNVLLQGVNGGLFENNLIENGGAWGIDSYAGDNITFRNNLIVNNLAPDLKQRVLDGEDIIGDGLEINGGTGNVAENNILYGNNGGLFASWILNPPETFVNPEAQFLNNISIGNFSSDFEAVYPEDTTLDFLDNDTGELIFTDTALGDGRPDDVDGDGMADVFNGALTLRGNIIGQSKAGEDFADGAPNRDGVDTLFADAQNGDFRVVAGSVLETDPRFSGIDPSAIGLAGDGPVDPTAGDDLPLPPVLPASGDGPSGNPLGSGTPAPAPAPDPDPGTRPQPDAAPEPEPDPVPEASDDGPAPTPPPVPASGARALGIGLYEVNYYSGVEYFNDVTQAMSGWISFPLDAPGTFTDGRPVELDANGFPVLADGQGARSFVLAGETTDGTETYTPGTYTLTWEGEADLEIQVNGARFRFDDSRNQIAENAATIELPAGVEELEVFLNVYEQGATPLSDVALFRPGTDADDGLFSAEFLALIEPFSTIRLMDWNLTNFGTSGAWEDRAQPGWASWGVEDTATGDARAFAQGVPYEAMIELANAADTDIWITIPHLADQDYVENLARLLDDTLEDGRTVTIEFSNEIWNGIFPVAQALDEIAAERNDDAGFGPEDDFDPAFSTRFTVAAERIVAIAQTFEDVFEDDSRYEIAVGGQAGWARPAEATLAAIDALGGIGLVDKLAVAPYFPDFEVSPVIGAFEDALADGRVTDAEYAAIFEAIGDEIDGMFDGSTDAGLELAGNKAAAERYGVALATYEAGQHFTASAFPDDIGADFGALNTEFQSRPEWAGIYARYLDGWDAFADGELTLYHLAGAWSEQEAFGHLRFGLQNPADSPKFQAVLDWLQAGDGGDDEIPDDDPDPSGEPSGDPDEDAVRRIDDIESGDAIFVYLLYRATLGRIPDEAGFRFWDGVRADGASRDDLASAFIESPEFIDRIGLDAPAEHFVDRLYGELLDRPGEDAGRSFWINEIETGQQSREDIVLAFVLSPEAVAREAENFEGGFLVSTDTVLDDTPADRPDEVPDTGDDDEALPAAGTFSEGEDSIRLVSDSFAGEVARDANQFGDVDADTALLLLHGLGGNPIELRSFIGEGDRGLDGLGEDLGFRTVYVEGSFGSWRFADDDAYFDDLFDALIEDGVDPGKIYVGGFSAGGFMTQYLGATRSGELAGIVSVAGHLPTAFVPGLQDPSGEPSTGLDALFFHNLQDDTVPYSLGEPRPVTDEEADAIESYAQWLDWNELTEVTPRTGTVTVATPADNRLFDQVATFETSVGGQATADGSPAQTAFYTLDSGFVGGHFWPFEAAGVDANRVIADFFDF